MITRDQFEEMKKRWPETKHFAVVLTARRDGSGFSGKHGPCEPKNALALETLNYDEAPTERSAIIHGEMLFAAVEKAISALQERKYADALQELVLAAYEVHKYAKEHG